ncbi:ABC transporter family protein [Isoptericola sp. CG 20/1183]|uniref:ABC transporter family protein n=1 Tax=Isoptericola halotolerans TaxID=300560 RepID=A0ABX5EIQ9_9MICO|nr:MULTISPECIES: ATP-binding cassette domain-containing protein [Isoptericola]MCK0118591.1 ATP-binding cassette domain-containing protein [Isoptericola sp. S6320L]PRZ09571.1 ABC transporter family protein [Isoptericola sp. CG 20/1183]PRZ10372.1 ABC transporter family protein [Isoptericola halotolerans]
MSTSSSPTPVLRADGLAAGYGGADVVHGIDLELTPGDAPVGIVGPSGAGKSTIVRALVGQVRPSAGRVTWSGRTVSRIGLRDKKVFRAQVRRVAQEGIAGVDPRTSVDRVIGKALSDARKAGRASGRSVEELLTDVALEPRFAPRQVGTLSGGEKQRVALAAALATRPGALLLDEPLTAVDPAMRGEVVRRLGAAATEAGTAVLLVSHDLELVERLCPTVHVLAEGTFVASGSLSAVLAEASHPSVRELAEAAPRAVQRFR